MENKRLNYEDGLSLAVAVPESANYALPDSDLLKFYNDLDNRIFWIDDDISAYTISIIHYILNWNRQDRKMKPEDRRPIRIFINSHGGDLEAMSAIANVIALSETPVIGINLSCAYSAAAMILLACHKRYGLKDSTVLFHKGSCEGVRGSYDEVAAFMKDYERQVDRLSKIIIERTSYSDSEVSEKMKNDWYVSADECVDHNVYDGIIKSINELL